MEPPSSEWTKKIVDSIIVNRSNTAIENFRRQPLANKLTALENAVVPPREDETASKVAALVKELIVVGALRPEEGAPVFSDLLTRVHKYNGSNAQTTINTLLRDIRVAQSEAIRGTDVRSLSNQAVLNAFLSSIPPTVPMGQENFEAFKQTLRLFVNEAPNCVVFRSGPDTMLQVNIRGVNTVNLNAAFSNLQAFWGVVLEGEDIPSSVSSKLSANTRVLMLLLAPFTNATTFSPDTFISALMAIYRDTVSASLETPEETESEITRLAAETGSVGADLSQTLGFLLKGKQRQIEAPRALTPRQAQILRFLQSSLVDRIDANGEDPAAALENIHLSFAPSFYAANGAFIRRLVSYFMIALQHSPSYFREIYANKHWLPPQSFWTQDYGDFFADAARPVPTYPAEPEDYDWDEFETAREASVPTGGVSVPPSEYSVQTSGTSDTSHTPVARRLAGAVLPSLAAAASEYYLPGSAPIASQLARVLTASALAPETRRRIKRLRDRKAREEVRRRLRRIAEANASEEGQTEEEDIPPLSPLLGEGVRAVERQNPFAYLAPKGALS
ncbi:IIIa [Psittacine adenovirus 3]|uniref:IIIa n=1 Tax=Psittacine adenovirus 3 TaxID=1580497 RepID=A0A0A7JT05_9ADEN|nr:IIIa [Psittacine adenovirus 3]AIZ35768.1 IIIa [Psittacine adenovirus 3]